MAPGKPGLLEAASILLLYSLVAEDPLACDPLLWPALFTCTPAFLCKVPRPPLEHRVLCPWTLGGPGLCPDVLRQVGHARGGKVKDGK